MIVIIEGPDCAGKTTLAQTLMARFNLGYKHEGPPPRDESAVEYYYRRFIEVRDHNVVLDRFALGERVYGPIVRGTPDPFQDDGWADFDRLLKSADTTQVLCLPPWTQCRDVWRTRQASEFIKDESVFQQIYERFKELSGTADVVFDWTRHSSEFVAQVALVRGEICRRRERGAP